MKKQMLAISVLISAAACAPSGDAVPRSEDKLIERLTAMPDDGRWEPVFADTMRLMNCSVEMTNANEDIMQAIFAQQAAKFVGYKRALSEDAIREIAEGLNINHALVTMMREGRLNLNKTRNVLTLTDCE
jgi:hypothetical protein